jgi:ParB-like chromosome segregation protein Spo0J
VRLPILKLRNVESRWEGHDILELQLDKIKDDQFAEQIQKRVYDPESNDIKRLATDLVNNGQKEPIAVDPSFTKIWRGHRRFLAAKSAGLRSLKAIVLTEDGWMKGIQNGTIKP